MMRGERQKMPSRVTLHPPVARGPGHDPSHRVRPRVDITRQPNNVDKMLHVVRERPLVAPIILLDLGCLTLAQEPHRPVDVDDVEARAPVNQTHVLSIVGMINSQLLVGYDGPPNMVAGDVPHLCQP